MPEAIFGYEKFRRLAQGKPFNPATAIKIGKGVAGFQLAMHAAGATELALSEEAREEAMKEAEELAKKGALERMATAAFVDSPQTIYAAGQGLYDINKTIRETNAAKEEQSRNFLEETQRLLDELEREDAKRDAERASKVGGAPSRSQLIQKGKPIVARPARLM